MVNAKLEKSITQYKPDYLETKLKWAEAFRRVFHRIETLHDTTYNHCTFSEIVMEGVVQRNTISNWLKGRTLPSYREDVIKLGIAAEYNEAEMNQLLLAAGKCQLCTQKRIAMTNEENVFWYHEEKKRFWESCRDFYKNIYIQFRDKYNIVKGAVKSGEETEDESLEKVSINALTGCWKESLNSMIYTAFRIHEGKYIRKLHIPLRHEIIVTGIILSYTKEEIDEALETMHYQTISETTDRVETVIGEALKMFGNEDKIFRNPVKASQNSLELYMTIRNSLRESSIDPAEYEWFDAMYPALQLTEFVDKWGTGIK